MSNWLRMGYGGLVDRRRVVAVGRARSATIKRLLAAMTPHRVLNLTYGYPREAVLLLDNGYAVLVSLTLEEIEALLHKDNEEGGDDEP
jgi:regulator of extracellular matrix RemA (YlzA/DUF370 family)